MKTQTITAWFTFRAAVMLVVSVPDTDSLYCAATSKKDGSKLKATLDGKQLDADVTVVDFNPTLYTIATESNYSSLTNAAGDLYVEEMEKEMKPVAVG